MKRLIRSKLAILDKAEKKIKEAYSTPKEALARWLALSEDKDSHKLEAWSFYISQIPEDYYSLPLQEFLEKLDTEFLLFIEQILDLEQARLEHEKRI